MSVQSVSKQTLQRLPQYLNFLKSMPRTGAANISATAIAEALGLGDVQVRKDLALVSSGGRPKVGYDADRLIADLERFLGYDDVTSAVIVGAGDLGRALLGYGGFAAYGIELMAAFDRNAALAGQTIHGKPVFPAARLKDHWDHRSAGRGGTACLRCAGRERRAGHLELCAGESFGSRKRAGAKRGYCRFAGCPFQTACPEIG